MTATLRNTAQGDQTPTEAMEEDQPHLATQPPDDLSMAYDDADDFREYVRTSLQPPNDPNESFFSFRNFIGSDPRACLSSDMSDFMDNCSFFSRKYRVYTVLLALMTILNLTAIVPHDRSASARSTESDVIKQNHEIRQDLAEGVLETNGDHDETNASGEAQESFDGASGGNDMIVAKLENHQQIMLQLQNDFVTMHETQQSIHQQQQQFLEKIQSQKQQQPDGGDYGKPQVIGTYEQISLTSLPLSIEEKVNGFKDVSERMDESMDLPVLWTVAKAGGNANFFIHDVLLFCHKLVMASSMGILEGHDQDTELGIVEIGSHKYVNVDVSSLEGLGRAAYMGFGQSGIADVMTTRYMIEANSLFLEDQHRGRVFAMFRHPVDRAVQNYLHHKALDGNNPQSDWSQMTLLDFAQSQYIENNAITRYLSSSLSESLSDQHLSVAKEIVRRKVLVGLHANMEESMERVEKFFHLKYRFDSNEQEDCRKNLMNQGANEIQNLQPLEKEVYDAIAKKNIFDINLYSYVEELFVEQGQFFATIPNGYRFERVNSDIVSR